MPWSVLVAVLDAVARAILCSPHCESIAVVEEFFYTLGETI